MLHDFGFNDHAPGVRPRLRLVRRVGIHVSRLVAEGVQGARVDHGGLRGARQYRVLAHRDHVVQPLVLQPVEHLGAGEAAIEPHAQARLRKGAAQQRDEAAQHADRAETRGGIAGTQDRGAQILRGLVIEGHKRQQRQIAPRVVVPIEERELLGAMRGVIGGIEIDRDAPRAAVQPALVPIHDPHREGVPHLIQLGAPHPVFKPRDGRLRGQRDPVDGIAVDQQFLNRIVGQPVRVVAIGIPARDPEDALRHQVVHRVRDFRRHPTVGQAARQRGRQAETSVRRFQENRPTIRTRVRLIKGCDERAIEQIREENSLWYRLVSQRKRLRCGERSFSTAFVPCGGVCVSTESQSVMNYSG